MSNTIWNQLSQNKYSDTSASSSYTDYIYKSRYQNAVNRKPQSTEQERYEILQRSCDLKSVILPDCIQKMTDNLDLDFNHQMKNEDVLEPQTVFQFDPKDIGKEWPKKKI